MLSEGEFEVLQLGIETLKIALNTSEAVTFTGEFEFKRTAVTGDRSNSSERTLKIL